MAKQQFPEPAVGTLIFNKEGKVLLMKSHKWRGKYVLAGGHIELGEKIEDALKREVKEETGLDIYDIEFICFQEFVFDNAYWKNRHFMFFNYACKTASTNVKLNSEAQEYVWVSLEEALKLPLEPYTVNTIKDYMKKKTITITEEKLIKYSDVTARALKKVRIAKEKKINWQEKANDFLDMAQRYFEDAKHFKEKKDYVTAFAALNYAHGWLDAGARLGLFNVDKDSTLFTVD